MPTTDVLILNRDRLLPNTKVVSEQVTALSLLDATTANFALTNAIWLFERPGHADGETFSLVEHLRQSLRATLDIYPQWCGHLKAVTVVNEAVSDEIRRLPQHAQRYGRVYVHYGTAHDPGVELVIARSSYTLDAIYSVSRTRDQPLWNRKTVPFKNLVPQTNIASALDPNEPNEYGVCNPSMAIQITETACGGFILAAKIAHPLADISSLVGFVKNWADVSCSMLTGDFVKSPRPLFDPGQLDAAAAGNINDEKPDAVFIQQAESLPLHRYDWWATSSKAPWPTKVPDAFEAKNLAAAGNPMPWSEWDVSAPVSEYIVHLNNHQVEFLHSEANQGASYRISRHDALVAHIWSCIMRARNLEADTGPVHCDLVYGVRPALNLGKAFLGSPTMMINVEMSGAGVTATTETAEEGKRASLQPIAQRIRETINEVGQPSHLAAFLHRLAYEASPQRLWQAFLGQRHVLVTSWARAGIYDIDFGVGSSIRYADGVVPALDGIVLIKEAPPSKSTSTHEESPVQSWTGSGIDVSINIREEDMQRLLKDPLLLPTNTEQIYFVC
ncbi:hypothetical protein AK830_g4458 [Neonectria ditissima]|uniref:Transferase family protein n=1 Tax=Neonectria ditissima TaxID=78410 RepID=A0A0P7AVX9_9HYPO|nr:hypothetical protein AK830_g4458 [Neonectria ditissima]